jgi:predicted nucleic acid-binding protein
MRYFDASALVKGYIDEADSQRMRRLLKRGSVATTRLSFVEVASALGRLGREGRLSENQRSAALAALTADAAALVVMELTGEIVSRAQALTQTHPLRAGNAIQLASCLYVRETVNPRTTLVSFDDRLNTAARLEGVTVAGGRKR